MGGRGWTGGKGRGREEGVIEMALIAVWLRYLEVGFPFNRCVR